MWEELVQPEKQSWVIQREQNLHIIWAPGSSHDWRLIYYGLFCYMNNLIVNWAVKSRTWKKPQTHTCTHTLFKMLCEIKILHLPSGLLTLIFLFQEATFLRGRFVPHEFQFQLNVAEKSKRQFTLALSPMRKIAFISQCSKRWMNSFT